MSKVKKIVFVIFSIIVLSVTFSISAFASSKVYNFNFSQPTYGDNFGYIEVDLGTYAYVIFFNFESNDVSSVDLVANYNPALNRITLRPHSASKDDTNNPTQVWAYYTISGGNGAIGPFKNNGKSLEDGFVYLDLPQPAVGFHYYGIGRTDPNLASDFVCSYGTDYLSYSMLSNIYKAIERQSGDVDKITSNADKNSSEIQANNDKNTQSIIDNQNQLAEQEKTETQNSGNDSVSDVSSSVPDKSAGMLSALQSLSNAVSYTGTVAKWKFPQMYIPAIAGVTDRINLNSEMEIDFTYWINQIPKDIRTVISALATIGLVIFAFKELYGLISYVLTLKGGGNNE